MHYHWNMKYCFAPTPFACSNNFHSLSHHVLATGTFCRRLIFDFLGFWLKNFHLEWVLYNHFLMSVPKWLLLVWSQKKCWFPNSRYKILFHIVHDQKYFIIFWIIWIVICMIIINICVTHFINLWNIHLVTMIWILDSVFVVDLLIVTVQWEYKSFPMLCGSTNNNDKLVVCIFYSFYLFHSYVNHD